MKFPSILLAATFFAAVLAMPTAAQENKAKHQKYQFFDMGTFGGPASYTLLNQGGQGTTVLNNRGMVAGSADTPTPDPYAPHCANPDCFVSHTFRWEDGALHDLGTIPSGSTSAATGTNARGSIAGFSQNGAIDPITGLPAGHAVLWTNDDMIDLGTLGGGYESLGVAVNDAGQVVGFGSNLVSDPFFGTQVRTFFWEKGVMRDVGTLGGPDCPPLYNIAINQRGQVVDDCFTNSTPNPITGIPTTDPFLWEKGRGMTDLGTLGGTIGASASVNDRGQVVGDSNLAGDGLQTITPLKLKTVCLQ